MFVLDPAKEVAMSPCKLCKTQPMSLQPLLHMLPHWYYPPLVHDVVTELETATQGYTECLDPFNLMKEVKCKLEKRENRISDEGEPILHLS